MRVLYVNQTGQVSGAERSLLSLIDGLGSRVEPLVACPEGELAVALRERGVSRLAIRGTEASFRLHPVHTARGVVDIGASSLQVRRLAAHCRPDVVHANTTRAALLALLARRSRPPVIAHIRDWVPEGRVSGLVFGLIARRADLVAANSSYIAEQFGDLPLRRPAEVVHNPVDLSRFDPARTDREAVRAELGIEAGAVALSVMAQLTPWKGQDDAIRIVAGLRRSGRDVTLLLAGSAKFAAAGTRFDNRSFDRDLRSLAAQLGVADRVRFLGERDDVPDLLAATDVLLLPSWREAFGRIGVEAMALGVPVAATAVGGPAEVVRAGVDGLLLEPRDPGAWAAQLEPLVDSAELRRAMGERGRERARDFGQEVHAERVLAIYRSLA